MHAKLIVVWGANPSVSGIHLVPFIQEARKQGAKLVVIDPRVTTLARQADLHVPLKVGQRPAGGAGAAPPPVRDGRRGHGLPRAAHDRSGAVARARVRVDLRARRRGGRRPGLDDPGTGRDVRRRQPGAHPVRLGPRAQPQRRERRGGRAGAAGGRRQVRRARRRLRDEQLGRLVHRTHVDRRGRARHPGGQHEPPRARAGRRHRAAREGALRLQLQPGGDGAEPEPGPAGPRPRGPVHDRVRPGDHRHRGVRRPRAAGDDVPRNLRHRQGLRPDQPPDGASGRGRGRRVAVEPRGVRPAARGDRARRRRGAAGGTRDAPAGARRPARVDRRRPAEPAARRRRRSG